MSKAPVYGWGRGSGVFLACCEKVILPLKQCRGDGLTPVGQVFFTKKATRCAISMKYVNAWPVEENLLSFGVMPRGG